MEIQIATVADLQAIQKIAINTWPQTYGTLMSTEQLTFMMDWMYNLKSLEKQFSDGQVFILVKTNDQYDGFGSYELNYQNTAKVKIHKLYVLPASQGKGIGNLLVQKIKDIGIRHQQAALILNVKRNNKAVAFYKRMGFTITDTVDLDIGHGFVMDDYVMEMPLPS